MHGPSSGCRWSSMCHQGSYPMDPRTQNLKPGHAAGMGRSAWYVPWLRPLASLQAGFAVWPISCPWLLLVVVNHYHHDQSWWLKGDNPEVPMIGAASWHSFLIFRLAGSATDFLAGIRSWAIKISIIPINHQLSLLYWMLLRNSHTMMMRSFPRNQQSLMDCADDPWQWPMIPSSWPVSTIIITPPGN